MKRRTRRYRGAGARSAMVRRFEDSGISVAQFCRGEGLSASSLHRWRAERDASVSTALSPVVPPPASSFVDLGTVGASRDCVELRVDLGGGLVLHLARG